MKWKNLNNFELERFVHHGLPFRRMRQIKRRMKKDAQLREEIQLIQQSNQDFLSKFPADVFIPKIIDRYRGDEKEGDVVAPEPARTTRKWLIAVPALAAALVIVILMALPKGADKASMVEDDIILKGQQNMNPSQPRLIVHRKNNSAVEVLHNGSIGRAGDLLQLAYIPSKQPYGIILSIDGSGNVSLHFPLDNTHSTSLAAEKFYLPEAIELDDAPYFERFFFITSQASMDVDYVLSAARKLAEDPVKAKTATLHLPAGFKQVSISIIKERQP